jgi:TolA-binding protein
MQSVNNPSANPRAARCGRAQPSALNSALFAFGLALAFFAPGLRVFAQSPADEAADPNAPRTPGGAPAAAQNPAGDETQAERRRGIVQTELARDGESRFRYARELYADARYARARDLLEDFLLLFPEHPRRIEALRITAEIDARNGNVEAAVRRFTRAYREAPDGETGARAYLQAGRLLAASGEPERARPIFEEVKRRVPSSATARLADQELLALDLPRARTSAGGEERPLLQEAAGAATNADPNANAGATPTTPQPAAADRRALAESGSSSAGAAATRVQTASPPARDSRGEEAQAGPAPESGRDARGDALDRMGEGVEAPPARRSD